MSSFGAFRPRAVNATDFNPLVLPNRIYWGDPDHQTTLSSGLVSSIADRGLNGMAFTQAVSSAQPSFATWRNNRKGMYDNPGVGSSGVLASSSGITETQPSGFVFAGQFPSPANGYAFYLWSNPWSPFFIDTPSGNSLVAYAGSTGVYLASNAGAFGAGLPFVAVVTLNGASTRLQLWSHGRAKSDAIVASSPGTAGTSGTLQWGDSASAQPWVNNGGVLATLGIFSSPLSDPDALYCLQGLCDYYGIVPL